MKKTIYTLLATTIICLASCGPKCKNCQAEAMGVAVGQPTEMCGDQLKQAEATGAFKCK